MNNENKGSNDFSQFANFTQIELQALSDMKLVYGATYRQVLSGNYGAYAPLGALIPLLISATPFPDIHPVDFLEKRIGAESTAKIYNHAYLNLGKCIGNAILEHNLNLLDYESRVPWSRKDIKQVVSDLFKSRDDEFLSVLTSLVAFDHLVHKLTNNGMSANDPIIKAAQFLQHEMMKGQPIKMNNPTAIKLWEPNRMLYTPIKDCLANGSPLISAMLRTIDGNQTPSDNYKIMKKYLLHMRMKEFKLTETNTAAEFIKYMSKYKIEAITSFTTSSINFSDGRIQTKTAFKQAINRVINQD